MILLIKRSWRQAPCTLNRAFFGRLIKTTCLESQGYISSTVDRLLILLKQTVSIGYSSAWITHSSEMPLNWLGASTNSFRILFVSWETARKSPTLKPESIMILNTVQSFSVKERKFKGEKINRLIEM
jgi:hypothetical protein